jgi:hypothetical protein
MTLRMALESQFKRKRPIEWLRTKLFSQILENIKKWGRAGIQNCDITKEIGDFCPLTRIKQKQCKNKKSKLI